MAIVAVQYGWMWAQKKDGQYSYTMTVQVRGVSALCEAALTSHWQLGDDGFDASAAFITQCVSASGVEEFPKDNFTSSPLTFNLYRDEVTSVTFKVTAFRSKAMGRWTIFHWGQGHLLDMFRRLPATASTPTPRQTIFLYDRASGEVVHVHQYCPLDPDTRCSEEEMERAAVGHAGPGIPRKQVGALHGRKGMQLNPAKNYRVDVEAGKLITEAAEQWPPGHPPARGRR